jgi:hypothetical protein
MKDGLPGPPQQNGTRDIVRGGDGRIWLLTLEGVAWIDPARIARNALPPPVADPRSDRSTARSAAIRVT